MGNENVTKAEAQYRVVGNICQNRKRFNNASGVIQVAKIISKLKTYRADIDIASLRATETEELLDRIANMANLNGLTLLTASAKLK